MEFIYFVSLFFFVIYLPGKAFLRCVKFENEHIVILRLLSLGVGITFFLLATYLLAYFKLSFLYNLLIIPAIVYELRNWRIKKPQLGIFFPEILVLLLGVLSMTYLTARSATFNGNIMQFFSSGGVDYIYHLSLIGNLTHDFPPTQPSLSGIPLRGYHFFYDLLVANFVSFYKINIIEALYRYFPVVLSFIYGLSAIALARFLKMKKITSTIFLFLMFFADGFQFLFNYLGLSGEYNSGTNSQLVYVVDPSVLLSIIILFSAFIVIFSKKRSLLLSVILFGILPQVKIYMAILAYAGLFMVALFNVYKKRDFYYFKTLFLSGIISAFIYLPTNFGAGGLVLAPLLFYKHFMETSLVFTPLKWQFKYQVYDLYHNYIRLSILYLIAAGLMFIPSMGFRIISLINLRKLKDKRRYTNENIFLGTIIVSGFLILTFFIQSISVFNIIQFLWIAYVILLIPTAIALGKFAESGVVRLIIVLVLVLILSLPENLRVINAFTNDLKPTSADLAYSAKKVGEIVKPNEKILLIRTKDTGVPTISALTSRSVYFEPAGLEFANTIKETEKRSVQIKNIEKDLDDCHQESGLQGNIINFMKKNNLSYVFSLQSEPCLSSFAGFEKIDLVSPYGLYKLK